MKYILICDCESVNFIYDENKGFTCNECNTTFPENEAGKHLLEAGGDT